MLQWCSQLKIILNSSKISCRVKAQSQNLTSHAIPLRTIYRQTHSLNELRPQLTRNIVRITILIRPSRRDKQAISTSREYILHQRSLVVRGTGEIVDDDRGVAYVRWADFSDVVGSSLIGCPAFFDLHNFICNIEILRVRESARIEYDRIKGFGDSRSIASECGDGGKIVIFVLCEC
jgi:hypothetical protein